MICLTFDTDRMDEERMREFLDATPIPGRATFFCTQLYDCLSSSAHEVAPHTYLGVEADWAQQSAEKRREFPDAVGWRSHSCVFSHILAEQIAREGFRYVSIHDQLGATNIVPTKHAWGLWHFPIYYMDNLDFSQSRFWGADAPPPFRRELIDAAVHGDALFVFGFHPIHLVLNSPNPDEYFSRREALASGATPDEIRYEGRGTSTFYLELVDAMDAAGIDSVALVDALEELTGTTVRSPARASR